MKILDERDKTEILEELATGQEIELTAGKAGVDDSTLTKIGNLMVLNIRAQLTETLSSNDVIYEFPEEYAPAIQTFGYVCIASSPYAENDEVLPISINDTGIQYLGATPKNSVLWVYGSATWVVGK